MSAPAWWRGPAPGQPAWCARSMAAWASGRDLDAVAAGLGHRQRTFMETDDAFRSRLFTSGETFERYEFFGVDLATGESRHVSMWA